MTFIVSFIKINRIKKCHTGLTRHWWKSSRFIYFLYPCIIIYFVIFSWSTYVCIMNKLLRCSVGLVSAWSIGTYTYDLWIIELSLKNLLDNAFMLKKTFFMSSGFHNHYGYFFRRFQCSLIADFFLYNIDLILYNFEHNLAP